MANDILARPAIPALTGIRFIAALLVVLAHTESYFAALQPAWLDYALRVGANLGMTTFFVLSGFVIHYNYGHAIVAQGAPAVRAFLVARFARLYPLYALALLIAIALSPGILSEETFRTIWAWRYLTMSQDWTPTLIDGRLLATLYIGSAWSISAEIALYIFYLPAALSLTALRHPRTALLAIMVLSVPGIIFVGGYATGLWLSDLPQQNWWLSLSPLCRIPEFFLGALIAQLYLVEQKPRDGAGYGAWLIGISGAAWIAALFLACYKYQNLQATFGFAPGVGALMYFLARYRSRAAEWVEAPVAVALGDASYSIYMLHGFVIGYVMRQSPHSSPVLRVALAWSLTALVSLAVYRYFEAPARRLIRRGVQIRKGVY